MPRARRSTPPSTPSTSGDVSSRATPIPDPMMPPSGVTPIHCPFGAMPMPGLAQHRCLIHLARHIHLAGHSRRGSHGPPPVLLHSYSQTIRYTRNRGINDHDLVTTEWARKAQQGTLPTQRRHMNRQRIERKCGWAIGRVEKWPKGPIWRPNLESRSRNGRC